MASQFINLKSRLLNPYVVFAVWMLCTVWICITQSLAGPQNYNNFLVFRGVFDHLFSSLPLYEPYPLEYGDINHYGPIFAFIIAPFAVLYNPAPGFVPALARSYAELCARYPDKRLHLIVVNDGSPHGFGEEQHGALRQAVPDVEIVDIPHGGKGAAIRAGIARSRAPYTIYTDIDMPYTAESMCEVIDRVFAGTDVVIAVRNRSYHSRLSPMRKMMSYGSKLLNRIFLNIRHTDTQGGLKGLSPRARAVMLRTRISDFLFDTEFVVLAARDKRLRIEEVETMLRDGIVMSAMSPRVLFRELRNFFRIAIRL